MEGERNDMRKECPLGIWIPGCCRFDRVGKTYCQGHQDPSKRVSIFLRETEANLKMVSIGGVSIPPSRTVLNKNNYYDSIQVLMI